MAGTEKRLERAEKHSNGEEKYREGWGRENRMPVLYQQPERKHRANEPGDKGPLECREHALAIGRNVP